MTALRRFRIYQAVFGLGLQNTFVYRWNFLIRALFGLVPLAGTVWIWKAIFEARGTDVGGYSFGEMIYYFLAILVVESLVSPSDDEWQIAADIREGQINAILLKPVSYIAYRASLFLSARLVSTLVAILPVAAAIYAFRQHVHLPSDALTWLAFGASLLMAAAIQFLVAYTLAILSFWILEISTLVFILYSFEYFLSGRIFPIDIMPDWLQVILRLLPFPYELYFPVAVLMEKQTGAALWSGLAIQAGWMTVIYLLSRIVWARGLRHYGAYGG
jgi:ABC-2 type transport system permease protein